MNAFWVEFFQALGFFAVMLFAMAVSVICAKSTTGIGIYIAGVLIQFISLIGNSDYILIDKLLVYYAVFFLIATVALCLLLLRRQGRLTFPKKPKKEPPSDEEKILRIDKRINISDAVIMYCKLFTIALVIIITFSSSYMAKNWFSYNVTVEKTRKEAYEYVTDRVTTYVCYTTTYGSSYHSKYCGYLWNSSHKTTVYEAEKRGYNKCSRCTPREKTVLELTETRYKDVKYFEKERKTPSSLLIWIGCSAVAVTFYAIITLPAKIIIHKGNKELKRINITKKMV